jgi:hypothetical protein
VSAQSAFDVASFEFGHQSVTRAREREVQSEDLFDEIAP